MLRRRAWKERRACARRACNRCRLRPPGLRLWVAATDAGTQIVLRWTDDA
ncbi:hypothetical protein LP420_41165 [Massilia sp. B-10]|nr:hypothetical protein LP420_41165 [Massilia sp. B-10]